MARDDRPVKTGENCAHSVLICVHEYIIFGFFSYTEIVSPFLLEDAKKNRTQG